MLPHFQQLEAADIRRKSANPHDVVTAADEAAEAFLTPALRELLPGSTVVGEEAAAKAPAVLQHLADPGPTWVVDPVDGTWNFSRGRPVFCMIVALVAGGETRGAWIHEPLVGTTAWAAPGEGAWLVDSAGGRARLAVDRDTPPEAWQVIVRGLAAGLLGRPRARWHFGAHVDHHCAGIEHRLLAEGSLHVGLYSRIKPWDHAAGALLHAEAGGHVARLDGSPYRPTGEVQGLLLAPSPEAWTLARRRLLGD